MNWTMDYFEARNYVRVISEDHFTVEEQIKRIEDLFSQKYWVPGLHVLFDNRKVDFSGIHTKDIEQIVRNVLDVESKIGDGKVAFLMGCKRDFGIGRQFEQLIGEKVSANVGIFLNENQALLWLGVK